MTIVMPSTRALSLQILARSHQLLARVTSSNGPFLRVAYGCASTSPPSITSSYSPLCSALPLNTRSYATSAPGKPKAHTGRTTTRKSGATVGTKTTKRTSRKAGTKAAPTKKVKTKTKTKPKPKPKPKPRKKPLSKTALKKLEVQKTKDLKEKALLNPPKKLPDTAWMVLLTESVSKGSSITGTVKEASQKYKTLSPEDHEHYNHTANENKAKNDAAYKKWLSTYTPLQITEANAARNALRRTAKKAGKKTTYHHIQDERVVKRPANGYTYFSKARFASGDLKNMKLAESSRLIGREWKALDNTEKKTYDDMASQDYSRYVEEVKTVYGKDVPPKAVRAS